MRKAKGVLRARVRVSVREYLRASGRSRVRLTALAYLLCALPAIAQADILGDAVRESAQGMLDYVVARVNAMGDASIPATFSNLFDGGYAASHIHAKAVEYYGSGVVHAVAESILALVLLVRLVEISERVDGNATLPAVREVVALLVGAAIYTYLIGHAWDLMAGLFSDLSAIWSSWTADVPAEIRAIELSTDAGLGVLIPVFVSSAIAMVAADVSCVLTKVIVWVRGLELYFMTVMSPIPLALLGLSETRQMGVGFLRSFASLCLGYAALAFSIKLFPTLLATAVATSWQLGGASDMVLSILAACTLQILVVTRCGAWAQALLGG